MWSNITDEDIENADDGTMPDQGEIFPFEGNTASVSPGSHVMHENILDSEMSDYAGQKREKNGQFGTGKKNGGGSSGTSKKPKRTAKKPKLLPREKAALHSELNTHLTQAERDKGIVKKNLFGAIYTVEIIDFDEYNILEVKKFDETRKEYLKDFRKKR